MSKELKEVLDKYKINIDDFFENMNKCLEANTDCYPGLTPRETKSLYREVSLYYSTINNTTKSFLPLNGYYEYCTKKEIFYKTEEPEVNQILEGGFKGGHVYNLMGPTATGKTSLMNSVVRANINNKEIKMIYFSFLYDNIDYDLEQYVETNPNSNLTIVENIRSFRELLLSDYFKNRGEKLKNYNIIIFDPFTIIVHRGISLDFNLLADFDDIMNDLAWRNNICVILGIYARKLNSTFWYYENDQKQVERLILSNYETYYLNPSPMIDQNYFQNLKNLKLCN
jgi:archaellum biogenesis ATPase FlaH